MRRQITGSHAHESTAMTVQFMRAVVLGLLVAILSGVKFARAEPAEVKRGAEVAAASCAKCHAIGTADESPQKGVPPFRAFKKIFPVPMLQKALTTGVVDGHEEMPMRELGFTGVRALLVYIDSLDPNGPKYIVTQP